MFKYIFVSFENAIHVNRILLDISSSTSIYVSMKEHHNGTTDLTDKTEFV